MGLRWVRCGLGGLPPDRLGFGYNHHGEAASDEILKTNVPNVAYVQSFYFVVSLIRKSTSFQCTTYFSIWCCSCRITMYFIGCVTLFFANNSSTKCRITIEFLHNFFYTLKKFLVHIRTMFINAFTKEFTFIHLVTFSISNSRIRMNFYFVYRRNVWMNW